MVLFDMGCKEKLIHPSTSFVVFVEEDLYAIVSPHVCIFNIGVQETQGVAVEFGKAGIKSCQGSRGHDNVAKILSSFESPTVDHV